MGSLELDLCLVLLGCRGAADDYSELWRVCLLIFLQLQLILIHLCEVHLTLGDLLAMHINGWDDNTITGKQSGRAVSVQPSLSSACAYFCHPRTADKLLHIDLGSRTIHTVATPNMLSQQITLVLNSSPRVQPAGCC